jgi:hypothetical protein
MPNDPEKTELRWVKTNDAQWVPGNVTYVYDPQVSHVTLIGDEQVHVRDASGYVTEVGDLVQRPEVYRT